jgi:hypothetical protein
MALNWAWMSASAVSNRMEKTDVGTDMRAPWEEEGGIIAQGGHDVK